MSARSPNRAAASCAADRADMLEDQLRDKAEVLRGIEGDRKSTRLNSSHTVISYAVFCFTKIDPSPSRSGKMMIGRRLLGVNEKTSTSLSISVRDTACIRTKLASSIGRSGSGHLTLHQSV